MQNNNNPSGQGKEPLTLGKLIVSKMNSELVDNIPSIPDDIFIELKADRFWPNSVPIITFRNMLRLLGIGVDEAVTAIYATYKLLIEAKRKEPVSLRGMRKDLWQCKEALDKYVTRLRELMPAAYLSSLPPTGEAPQDKMEVLRLIIAEWNLSNNDRLTWDAFIRFNSEAQSLIAQLFSPAAQPTELTKTQNMKSGIELIAEERQEQISKHNRTIQSDVEINSEPNGPFQLPPLVIAATKCLGSIGGIPWPSHWDKSICEKIDGKTEIEKLVRAGAFIAAEIDRRIELEKLKSHEQSK